MLVGYMRVSSDSDRQNTDLQKDALIKAGVDERNIFKDKASGAKDDRKGLKELIDFVKEGDTVVVWKLDRLGRSLSHLITILEILRDKKAAFRSLTDNIDTETASGELFFHVFGALAQYERALIKERVNAGLEAARSRGIRGGRPRTISDEKLEVIKKALDEGMSKSQACRTFGVKRSTLIDSLKRVLD